MKRVVVPVDFSETSAVAIKFGVYLAELMTYNVDIVHVSDLVLSGAHSLTTPEQNQEEKKLRIQLAEFVGENVDAVFIANRDPSAFIPKVRQTVLSGTASNQILSLSKQADTGLIVMGGVGAEADIHPPGLYGSVATPIAKRGGCPVILVPKGYDPVAVKKIAIAFDDADEIIRIGQFSRSFLESLRPEVRYVHVSKANWREELENEEDFMDLTWNKGVPSYRYESDLLPAGDVAKQLSRYVVDKQIDLLILGGKRHGFWSRLFDKKHLKMIIQSSKVLMMIVPFSSDGD